MAEYGYQKIIKENNLSIADLPEEVQVAIEAIVDIEKGFNIIQRKQEKQGKEFVVSEKTKKKLKTFDGFAVRGIQEFMDGKEVTATAPVTETTVETIIAEVKAENATPAVASNSVTVTDSMVNTATAVIVVPEEEKPKSNDVGTKIEAELAELHKSGVTEISLSDLKSKAPSSYKVIFENYSEAEENGIDTTNFKLIENDKKEYTLSKK